METILFSCKDNAGLSPMAVVFFNSMVNQDALKAVSAGIRPAERIRHEVVRAMRELDIDLSTSRPRLLTPEALEAALFVVTLGAEEEYSVPSTIQREHWSMEECDEKPIAKIRRLRNEVERLVRDLVSRKGWMKSIRRRTSEWAPTGLSVLE